MAIRLVVFDMAGTTVRDQKEVETCFAKAARQTGLVVSDERITAVQGWSKRFVFETLWGEQLGTDHPDLTAHVDESYDAFRQILEAHYQTEAIYPTVGCLDTFEWLRQQGIAIALTTGFYRKVTDLILHKLGWDAGLDEQRIGNPDTLIQMSVASDEVAAGRPAPDMIRKVMQTLHITDPAEVINIGDTPSDLESGRRAGVRLSLGLTNGTHTAGQLAACPNDGLLGSLAELPGVISALQV
ncbi:HAD family hydrolase [Arsenicibacter rosenii]|uniref:Phosphatase n=1 Tax=Arsenicibacter rosenii TaxID=1750698 RepID=A0A1S2VCJ6_9BACT|nr:HAD family hydrolase [Arsenicibacter rosenii]OIN56412.1 phosphatase [Arsenicibacter rosenii]